MKKVVKVKAGMRKGKMVKAHTRTVESSGKVWNKNVNKDRVKGWDKTDFGDDGQKAHDYAMQYIDEKYQHLEKRYGELNKQANIVQREHSKGRLWNQYDVRNHTDKVVKKEYPGEEKAPLKKVKKIVDTSVVKKIPGFAAKHGERFKRFADSKGLKYKGWNGKRHIFAGKGGTSKEFSFAQVIRHLVDNK